MSSYGYDSSYAVGSAVGGVVAGVFIFLAIIVIICLAVAILQIIGQWKLLSKAGKPGWGALIPFYNQYLLCDAVGVSPWWVLITFLSALLTFIPVIGSLLSIAISICFMIILNVSVARSFGKEDSYAVGLILLQPIFYFILGLKGEYVGKKPMEDKVMNAINKNSTSNTTDALSKFCTACGTKVSIDTKFCPSCGNEMK